MNFKKLRADELTGRHHLIEDETYITLDEEGNITEVQAYGEPVIIYDVHHSWDGKKVNLRLSGLKDRSLKPDEEVLTAQVTERDHIETPAIRTILRLLESRKEHDPLAQHLLNYYAEQEFVTGPRFIPMVLLSYMARGDSK